MTSSNDAPAEASNPLADPDDFGFLYGLARAPCFRETALYSLGGSAVLGGLHFQRNRDPTKAAETMVKAGCAFALLHWTICRKRYYDEREATYEALEGLKKRQSSIALQRARKAREKEAQKGPEQENITS